MTDVNESRIKLLQRILAQEDFKENHPETAEQFQKELRELLELKRHGEIPV